VCVCVCVREREGVTWVRIKSLIQKSLHRFVVVPLRPLVRLHDMCLVLLLLLVIVLVAIGPPR